MNGTPRHTHHHHKHQPRPSQRRRLRRRQQITAILAVVGVTLLLLVTVMLIVGARMHKKSVALAERESSTESELLTPETPSTPSVIAYPLAQDAPYASLAALSEDGKLAASLALNDKQDGTLLCSVSTIASIASDAKKQGIYLSGVFYLHSLSEEDDLLRFEKLSDECVTLAEDLRAGLDEVMLIAPALSEAHLEELSDFLNDLRRLVPNATVGLALPQSFLTEEHVETIDTLAKNFSLLSIDLSDEEEIDARVKADLYYLLRYAMRVLLPSADIESLTDAVTSHGVENIQFLP